LLSAAAVVASAVAIAPAEAAFPGEDGPIAFERGFNVFTINPDGSGTQQVTTSGATFDPAVDATGRRIAFSRSGDIWVMDADGDNARNLTASLGSTDREPAWSPDGTRIAFSRGIPDAGGFRIWAVDADGTNPTQVTSDAGSSGDFAPAWRPDGTRIAYTRVGPSSDIYTVDPSGGGTEVGYVVTNRTENHPSWSPDGSAIAFTTNVADGNGNEVYRQVGAAGTPTPVGSSPADDNNPSWSPDGTRIAFTSNRTGSDQIWTVGSSGVEQAPVNVAAGNQPDWGVRPAGPAPPEMGEVLNARALEGTVRVQLPGSKRFVAVDEAAALPVGSTFDTRKGTVQLTFAAGLSTGSTQSGTFRGGLFATKQSRRSSLTELRLKGAKQLNRCSKRPKGGAAAAAKRSRRLFANARGRFRTRGRNSTATVRGTKWLTTDTCKGTLTRVMQGTVVVRDLARLRNVTLKKGQRYLARARRR
jgi:hypothetical protein